MVPDEVLYARLLRGDLGAFDVLYDRHERPLFGFILRHLGDRQEAEDALHDVFLTLLRDRHAERKLASVRAWLFEVARNQCLNTLRGRRRATHALERITSEPQLTAAPQQPEHLLEDREATEALREAVGRLPEPLARLYELRTHGLSYEELASALSLPLGTVKSRMHEMVARLREEMAHEL
jgi:RNA polymerase sigma-70 factor (ECF subfamily)